MPRRTDEDTIALVRRLAAHYCDAVIAGILNRQDRKSAYGRRFTAGQFVPALEDSPLRASSQRTGGRTADDCYFHLNPQRGPP